MSTIRETALACYGGRLPRGTGAKAQEVLDCLVAREQEMFESLVEAGVALGATRDQVHLALADAGMHAPPTPWLPGEVDGGDIGNRLSALERKVDDAIRRGEQAIRRLRRR
jgi:hypothetical protein